MLLPPILALACPTLEFPVRSARISLASLGGGEIPLVVRNGTSRPVTVWHAGFFPNHDLDLRNAEGRPVARTPLGKTWRTAFEKDYRNRDKNAPLTIPAGGSDRYATPPLAWGFVLRPGAYRLTVEYWERLEMPHLRMRSGPLRIVVVP